MRAIKALLALVLIGALAGTGPAARAVSRPKRPPQGIVYLSANGYQITPAAGWLVNSTGVSGTDVFIYSVPVNGFASNLNVVITAAPKGRTLADGRAQLNALYPRLFNGYKPQGERFGSLDGIRTLEITANYRLNSEQRIMRLHQVIALRNGLAYTFTCTTPDAGHGRVDPVFAAMLKSVRWSR